MSFELSSPHGLALPDARARLHALGDYLSNKYGLTVAWTGLLGKLDRYLDPRTPLDALPRR